MVEANGERAEKVLCTNLRAMDRPRAGGQSPIEVPPAYGVVVEHIRRAIHLGVYSAGTMLPPERVHAKELGVSRVTLREALRVLEGEGYIQMRRGAHGGALVLIPRQSRSQLRQQIGELLAIQEFRRANESLAARRAASRIGDEDLERLEATIETIRHEPEIDEFRRADSEFHLLLAEAAESELVYRAVEEARAAMFPALDLLSPNLILSNAIRGHERIVAALRERDPDRASRAMTAHIDTTTKELNELLAEAD